jgi:hypothetical protein
MTIAKQLDTSTDYVEVDLSIDLVFHVPSRNEDGTLGFREFRPDEAWSCIKVKVPSSVVNDQRLLSRYVYHVMSDHVADIVDLRKVNIWEEEKDDFRFPY